MSSYLNIYLVPKRKDKKEEKQHLLLSSYSRNSDLYTAFCENASIAYSGNSDKYTILNRDNVQPVLESLDIDIKSSKERLELYEKYASSNPDYIQDIISLRNYIRDNKETLSIVSFIYRIVTDITEGYSDFEEVCCNIN